VEGGRAFDRVRASPWSKAILSYKTHIEGTDDHDIDESPMHGVELHGGFPCDHLSES
jgi:hypothetical protein